MSVFAERLKNLRDTKGQTQGEVGKAVGKSRESVSKYEIGEREPDTEVIAAIAKHFNVSADYILGITDDLVALIDKSAKSYCIEIVEYETYFKDEKFVPYFNLSIKMKDHDVEIRPVDRFIDHMIKMGKKQKHP